MTVFGPGGSQRVFQADTRGGYFNQAGDYGTLVTDGAGGYLLTEKTGMKSDYAANGVTGHFKTSQSGSNQNRPLRGA